MKSNNEAARIALAAINNQIGKLFAAGNGKVLRAERSGSGFDVWAVVVCTRAGCNQTQTVSVRKLGDLLRYPNETLNFACVNPQCPSRTSTPAKPQLESELLRFIAEKEFADRRAQQPVPMNLQKSYARLYAAWSLTSPTIEATDHPQWFSRESLLSMSPQNRAAWEKWASDTMLLEGGKRRQAAANGGA
jgi:hypothetical protein